MRCGPWPGLLTVSDWCAPITRQPVQSPRPIAITVISQMRRSLRQPNAIKAFHNHELGQTTRHGFHALALNETRRAYEPVLWATTPGFTGTLQQMWFRGTHGDIGGQQHCRPECRPLANIPLTWMLEKAERCALPLPKNWRDRFPTDPTAPSIGNTKGWGKLFLNRKPRTPGTDPSEALHPSAR